MVQYENVDKVIISYMDGSKETFDRVKRIGVGTYKESSVAIVELYVVKSVNWTDRLVVYTVNFSNVKRLEIIPNEP